MYFKYSPLKGEIQIPTCSDCEHCKDGEYALNAFPEESEDAGIEETDEMVCTNYYSPYYLHLVDSDDDCEEISVI